MCYDAEKTQAPRPIGFEPMSRNDYPADPKRDHIGDQIAGAGYAHRLRSDREIVEQIFTYHPPNELTLPKFNAINQAAKNFAEVILQNVPPGMDRTVAINYIRLARMLANAGISLNGLSL
jgi:hypothetical protein